jgi:rubrerythrin
MAAKKWVCPKCGDGEAIEEVYTAYVYTGPLTFTDEGDSIYNDAVDRTGDGNFLHYLCRACSATFESLGYTEDDENDEGGENEDAP